MGGEETKRHICHKQLPALLWRGLLGMGVGEPGSFTGHSQGIPEDEEGGWEIRHALFCWCFKITCLFVCLVYVRVHKPG